MKKLFLLRFVAVLVLMISGVSCTQPQLEPTSVPITSIPSLTPTATYLPITPVFSETQVPNSESVISSENINRLTLSARWGNGNLSDAQYTPDGKYLIVTSSIGVYFYNALDYSLIKFIDLKTVIFDIAITQDSERIAITSLDKVFIFNQIEDQPILILNEKASSLDFSPNGQILVLGTYNRSDEGFVRDGNIKLFDSFTGDILLEFEQDTGANTIDFSPDGTLIAVGDNTTQIWSLDGKLLDTHGVYVSGGSTYSLSFSPDGTLLAEGALTDNVLHVWRVLDNGRLIIFRTISLDSYPLVFEVAISPDGTRLAAATSSGLFIWQLDSGKLIFNKNENNLSDYGRYHDITWSPDSNSLVALSENIGLGIWDMNNGELLHSSHHFTGPITSMAWQPNGDMIASAEDNGTIFLLDSQNGNIVNTFDGDSIENNFALSPDGNLLAIKSDPFTQEGGVVITKLTDNTFRYVLEDSYGDGLSSQSFSRDGRYLVTSGFENGKRIVQIWNTEDWSLNNSWLVDDELLGQLIFSPDGDTIALVESRDSKIKFYTIVDGKLEITIELSAPIGRSFVNAIAFSPDGQKLLTMSRDPETSIDVRKVLRIWQVETENLIYLIKDIQGRQRIPPFPNYSDIPSSIAWSPSGELFVVGFSDGTIGIFRSSDGKLLQTLSEHTMMVMGITFSPNGHILASASLDGTIRLWSIK